MTEEDNIDFYKNLINNKPQKRKKTNAQDKEKYPNYKWKEGGCSSQQKNSGKGGKHRDCSQERKSGKERKESDFDKKEESAN